MESSVVLGMSLHAWAHMIVPDVSTTLLGADLSAADLSGADLSEANLRYADLTGATVTDQQLALAWSLRGATLPDGTVHR